MASDPDLSREISGAYNTILGERLWALWRSEDESIFFQNLRFS